MNQSIINQILTIPPSGKYPIFLRSLDAQALGWGLVLGHDEGFSRDLKKLVRQVGVSHLTAASGANISLFQSVFSFLGRLGWLQWCCQVATVPAYWLLSGASGSLFRASVQALFAAFARFIGRPVNLMVSLVLAGLCGLSLGLQADLGFLLSWLACLGIIISRYVISGENENSLSPRRNKIYSFLQKIAIEAVTVHVLVSLVIFSYFNEWQPNGIIGTVLSQPVTTPYILIFVVSVLSEKGNSVAKHISDNAVELSYVFRSGADQVLHGLFSVFLWIWLWTTQLPLIFPLVIIGVALWISSRRLVQKVLAWFVERKDSREWGWSV